MSEREDGEVDERQEQLEAEQAARRLLHDPDPTERSEGIAALADLDEETARRALEGALRESEPDADVRWETYDRLMDLSETEDERIRVAISALADRLASVRDQAAYYLSTEDADAHPELLPAMRRALSAEDDPDAQSSIESALESLDPEFVPAWQLELDGEEDESAAIQ
jgi:HEAT repeat protein